MPDSPVVPIVNVGYRSTNYWVVGRGPARLLVDLGWPGTLGAMRASFERMGVPHDEIRYGMATHYHVDHAGLGEELKRLGMTLLVLAPQVAAIREMTRWTKPEDRYVEIVSQGSHTIELTESRAVLATIGLAGEIVATPGHSDDSVSLVLDQGAAFTGDLTPMFLADDANRAQLEASWERLRSLGVSRIYPGHGPVRPMPVLG